MRLTRWRASKTDPDIFWSGRNSTAMVEFAWKCAMPEEDSARPRSRNYSNRTTQPSPTACTLDCGSAGQSLRAIADVFGQGRTMGLELPLASRFLSPPHRLARHLSLASSKSLIRG